MRFSREFRDLTLSKQKRLISLARQLQCSNFQPQLAEMVGIDDNWKPNDFREFIETNAMPGRGGRSLDQIYEEFFDSLWQLLGLGTIIAIGVMILFKLRSRFSDDADSDTNPHAMLSQIHELRREGELTDEEYRSIKGRLVERLDGSSSAPQTPSVAGETSETVNLTESDGADEEAGDDLGDPDDKDSLR